MPAAPAVATSLPMPPPPLAAGGRRGRGALRPADRRRRAAGSRHGGAALRAGRRPALGGDRAHAAPPTAAPRSPSTSPRGAYRVTRCGADGRPRVSQTVVPDPRSRRRRHARADRAPGARPDRVAALRRPVGAKLGGGLPRRPAPPAQAADARPHARRSPTRRRRPPAPAEARAPTRSPRRAAAVTTAAAGDTCTNTQYSLVDRHLDEPRLRLPRQPQPLQLQRHDGRLDRPRPHELGHDVQQLRPERHHEPHVVSPRLDGLDDPHLPRRRVGHRPRRHGARSAAPARSPAR